jgi:hypothetical protein
MADYQAPLRDMSFVLNEVFQAPAAVEPACRQLAEAVDVGHCQCHSGGGRQGQRRRYRAPEPQCRRAGRTVEQWRSHHR